MNLAEFRVQLAGRIPVCQTEHNHTAHLLYRRRISLMINDPLSGLLTALVPTPETTVGCPQDRKWVPDFLPAVGHDPFRSGQRAIEPCQTSALDFVSPVPHPHPLPLPLDPCVSVCGSSSFSSAWDTVSADLQSCSLPSMLFLSLHR